MEEETTAVCFPYADMLPEMRGEVRAQCTASAQFLLALTCRAEYAWAYNMEWRDQIRSGTCTTMPHTRPVHQHDTEFCLGAADPMGYLARDGELGLLRRFWTPTFRTERTLQVCIEAIIHGQWPVVAWLLVPAPREKWLVDTNPFYSTHAVRLLDLLMQFECPDMATFQALGYNGSFRSSYTEYVIEMALEYNHTALMARLLPGLCPMTAECIREYLNHYLQAVIGNGMQQHQGVKPLAMLDRRAMIELLGDCPVMPRDTVLLLWRLLLLDMVYRQWTPGQITAYCRAGIHGVSLMDTLTNTHARYVYMQCVRAWAVAYGNTPVVVWCSSGGAFDDVFEEEEEV
jgi:hypothetical protein